MLLSYPRSALPTRQLATPADRRCDPNSFPFSRRRSGETLQPSSIRSKDLASLDVRVTSGGKVHDFVSTTLEALPRGEVRLSAVGAAVSKAVTVAEITKRRLAGLHQCTRIGLSEPGGSSAGCRQPIISITLSLAPLASDQPGYQPPLSAEELVVGRAAEGGDGEMKARAGRKRVGS